MAKHSQAFVEIAARFYVPLHDLKDIQDLSLSDLLNQGQVKVHKPKKQRKEASNAQPHNQ